jgi:hypothetical protein
VLRVRTVCDGGILAATVVLLVSACASPDTRAGRDLADTVRIEGLRKVSEEHKGETTLLYFVGPASVDLRKAVKARNWSPEPPPSGLPEVGAYKWVLAGSANTDNHHCNLAVSTLRPGFENVAIELDDKQKQELAAGRLTYVEVASVCAGAP